MSIYTKCDFKQLVQEAKKQGLSRSVVYANGAIGYLVFRGFFGGVYNFAYASLDTMDEGLRRDALIGCYDGLKKYW